MKRCVAVAMIFLSLAKFAHAQLVVPDLSKADINTLPVSESPPTAAPLNKKQSKLVTPTVRCPEKPKVNYKEVVDSALKEAKIVLIAKYKGKNQHYMATSTVGFAQRLYEFEVIKNIYGSTNKNILVQDSDGLTIGDDQRYEIDKSYLFVLKHFNAPPKPKQYPPNEYYYPANQHLVYELE